VDSVCCTLEGGTPAPPGVLCEGDADGDGVDATCGDACPDDPEKTAPGLCGCGIPDLDSDGDTVADCRDLCPNVDDRVDKDGDGYPDCALGLARIPTVSLWGVCILTLLLLIAGKISFQRPGSRPGTLT